MAEIAARCDALAQQIAQDVHDLSAILLLDRAWWSKIPERFPETETDGLIPLTTLFDENTARIRLVEYLQSIIASVPTRSKSDEDIPEEVWEALLQNISDLFDAQLDYAENAYDQKFEESASMYRPQLRSLLAYRWILVHGHRYPVHWRPYYIDMLLPFDALFREVYGVSATHIVGELMKLHYRETYHLLDAVRQRQALVNILDDDTDSLTADEERQSAEDELRQINKMLYNFEFFELTHTCHLPEELLDDLTWRAGQDVRFYGEGTMQGWLLKRWPTYERPFIEIADRRYCYETHVLSDRAFSTLRRAIRSRGEQIAARWDEIQGKLAEDLAFQYLARLVPSGRVIRNIHYSWQGNKYECDGVVVVGRLLIIVEVKGRKVAEVPPALMFEEYLESALDVIQEPVRQGNRLRGAIIGAGSVRMFDSAVRRQRQSVGQLRATDFDHMYVVSVTLESVSEISTQIHRLHGIAESVGDTPTWSVSMDDLRVCADVFADPDVFMHYLHERMQMARIPKLAVIDETDFVGLYVADSAAGRNLGTLVSHSGADLLVGTSPSLVVDQHFKSVNHDGILPIMVVPEIPGLVGRVWKVVAGSMDDQGELKRFLLNLGARWQAELGEAIESEWLRRRVEGGVKPISANGDFGGVTVFPWGSDEEGRDIAFARRRTEAVMAIRGEERRFMMELSILEDGEIEWVDGEWISASESPSQLARALADAEELRSERRSRDMDQRRARRLLGDRETKSHPGRNEPCPCGSGKKYKRCCLNRDTE